MKQLSKFNLIQDYENAVGGGGKLFDYQYFTALVEENDDVYYPKDEPYIIINIEDGNTEEIYEILETGDYKSIEVEGYESKIYGLPYGFKLEKESGGYDGTKYGAISLIDLSNYDSSQVTDMSYMFGGYHSTAKNFSVRIGKLNTSNVQNMSGMFTIAKILDPENINSFDTSNVTDMSSMFYKCYSLINLNLSGFDTSKVLDMNSMFKESNSLIKLDLSGFDTSKVTDMGYMFSYCEKLLELDLSGFDTSKATNIGCMFLECSDLEHIKCKNHFYEWCITNSNEIDLPNTMVNGTVGNDETYNWYIID